MTKSRRTETFREEAVRLDALEDEGKLDELPFTRTRRYAKEPSQVYAIRIPVTRLAAIRWLAEGRSEQPTALLREWVLERLDAELAEHKSARAREASSPYDDAKLSRTGPSKKRLKGSTRKASGARNK